MATKENKNAPMAVWVQFREGRVRAELVERHENFSRVRFIESRKFSESSAVRGEERTVLNSMVTAR